MSEVAFKTRSGKDPAQYLLDIREAAQPTQDDLAFTVEGQKTRILDRTARGVDVDEQPFPPYSTKGPYYYYPNGRLGSLKPSGEAGRKQNYNAAKRLHAKINAGRTSTPVGQVTPGGAIKFASYAEFKNALGRVNVDLLGPRAPHMLQAMVVTVRSASEATLGIYGDEAARASGHNQGTSKLPRRYFFGASVDDVKKMASNLSARILTRLREKS